MSSSSDKILGHYSYFLFLSVLVIFTFSVNFSLTLGLSSSLYFRSSVSRRLSHACFVGCTRFLHPSFSFRYHETKRNQRCKVRAAFYSFPKNETIRAPPRGIVLLSAAYSRQQICLPWPKRQVPRMRFRTLIRLSVAFVCLPLRPRDSGMLTQKTADRKTTPRRGAQIGCYFGTP